MTPGAGEGAGRDGGGRWVRAAPGQVSTELEGEVVILDAEAGRYFGVDGVGAWIWERIQEPARVEELLDGLVEAYDVERDRARRDLESFLEELDRRGLAEVSDAPPG